MTDFEIPPAALMAFRSVRDTIGPCENCGTSVSPVQLVLPGEPIRPALVEMSEDPVVIIQTCEEHTPERCRALRAERQD